jgi:hypothetical protein
MWPGGTGDGMAHGVAADPLEFGAGWPIRKQGRVLAQVAVGGNVRRSGKRWHWTVGQGVMDVSGIKGNPFWGLGRGDAHRKTLPAAAQ